VALGVWGTHEANQSLPTWGRIVGYALTGAWALAPIVSALLAFKTRRWVGWVWLLGVPPAYFSARRLLIAIPFEFVLGPKGAVLQLLLLLALGAYWLVTSALKWPPVLAPSTARSGRTAFVIASSGALACALALIWTALITVQRDPVGDCGGMGPPSSKQRWPYQVLFIATDAVRFGSEPTSGLTEELLAWLAIARVQEHFWGLPWWDRKFVLLLRSPSWHGKPYLIEAIRPSGSIAAFLPVVRLLDCSRSDLVSRADIDLRVLKDGRSQTGARIIGYANWGVGETWQREAGIKVTIAGPTGTMMTTTDAKGIYDFPGLPPGTYSVHADLPPQSHLLHKYPCYSPFQLKREQIVECDVDYK